MGHTVECIAEADGLPIVTSFSTLPFLFRHLGCPRSVTVWLELEPICRCTMPMWPLLNCTRNPLLMLALPVSAAMDEAFRTRAFTYFGAWCKTSRPVKRSVGLCWK